MNTDNTGKKERAPQDTSLVNQQSIDLSKNKENLNQKIDVRNTVDYTFRGTSEESFDHKLGRTPQGYSIGNQTKPAHITGDKTKWTSRKIVLSSSMAGNEVTFLFY